MLYRLHHVERLEELGENAGSLPRIRMFDMPPTQSKKESSVDLRIIDVGAVDFVMEEWPDTPFDPFNRFFRPLAEF